MGFVEGMIEYGSNVTDAPLVYYRGAAYFALSATVNGRVKIRLPWGDVKPNVWIMLLGRSTIDRKTTVVDDITMPIIMSVPSNKERIVSTEFTPESLIEIMSERNPSRGFFVRDEFAGFMSSMGKSYMESVYELLMKLYDSPKFYSRKIRSNDRYFVLNDVYFSMFCGTTYNRLEETAGKAEILSGFIPRFLILTHDGPRSQGGMGARTAEDDARQAVLGDALVQLDRALRETEIDMSLSDAAAAKYFDWRKRREADLITGEDEVSRVVFGRASMYVLKIAILEEISEWLSYPAGAVSFPTKIREDTLMNAIYFVEMVEGSMIDRMRRLASDVSVRLKEELREEIAEYGKDGVAHHEILRLSRMKRATFMDLIETLVEEHRISDKASGLSGEPIYVAMELEEDEKGQSA